MTCWTEKELCYSAEQNQSFRLWWMDTNETNIWNKQIMYINISQIYKINKLTNTSISWFPCFQPKISRLNRDTVWG
jgi:3-oxoacyl-[acyl-carrier-protein] synthase III